MSVGTLDILTVEEVAAILRVSEDAVYRRIKSGKLVAIKDGFLRIRREDLEAYMNRQLTNRQAAAPAPLRTSAATRALAKSLGIL